VLNLIGANRGQFLTVHTPHINSGIVVHSSTHNVLLILSNMHGTLVALEQISLEFIDLSKIDTVLTSFEFIIYYCLIEIEAGVVVLLAYCDGCG